MPITITTNQFKFKDPTTGQYRAISAVADESLEERLAAIESAGNTAVSAVTTAQATAVSAIDSKKAEAVASVADAAEVQDMVAGVFDDTKNYSAGDYVIYETSGVSKLYRFIADHAAGAWAGNDVVEVKLSGEVGELKSAFDDVNNEFNKFVGGESPLVQQDYTKVNGTRIYKNDNVFSVYGQAANYGYISFFPIDNTKLYTIKPTSGVKYYWYNTDVNAFDATITDNATPPGGWSTAPSSVPFQYSYLLVSFYKEDGTALADNEGVSILATADVAYVAKNKFDTLVDGQPIIEKADYTFINGTRIYKNGSAFSIFSFSTNYGYINFCPVEVGKTYIITPPEHCKQYWYNTDVHVLDVTASHIVTPLAWSSVAEEITAQYPYLLVIYYNENSTALTNNDYVLIEEKRIPPYTTKIELKETVNLNRVNEIKSVGLFAENNALIQPASVYYVGADKEYTTINAALEQWAIDNYPQATVYISNGEYNETVYVEDHDITFIGESRDGTIVRTTTGNYTYPPFKIHHGNVTVMNLTAIADHSSIDDWQYEANKFYAYAFHIDGGHVGGTVLIKNCTAISYQCAAFGMGTIPNSKIRIEDCTAISYTGTDATDALALGCVLNHLSSPSVYPTPSDDEVLEMVNVRMYAKNTGRVLHLSRGDNAVTNYKFLAINCALASGTESDYDALVYKPVTKFFLDSLSSGNTCETINN